MPRKYTKKKKRSDKKMNTLRFTIPGLERVMEVVFPAKKLPVCGKCKKIFKTRQLCRERDGHTDYPWSKTYMCFEIDESCFEDIETPSSDDKVDKKLVKDNEDNTYTFTADIVECSGTEYFGRFECKKDALDPICRPCKVKNYTRTHCRLRHQHKNLPWGTVYMTIKAEKVNKESDDGEEIKAGSKRKNNDYTGADEIKRVKCDHSQNDNISVALSSSSKSKIVQSSHLYSDRNGSNCFLLSISSSASELQVSVPSYILFYVIALNKKATHICYLSIQWLRTSNTDPLLDNDDDSQSICVNDEGNELKLEQNFPIGMDFQDIMTSNKYNPAFSNIEVMASFESLACSEAPMSPTAGYNSSNWPSSWNQTHPTSTALPPLDNHSITRSSSEVVNNRSFSSTPFIATTQPLPYYHDFSSNPQQYTAMHYHPSSLPMPTHAPPLPQQYDEDRQPPQESHQERSEFYNASKYNGESASNHIATNINAFPCHSQDPNNAMYPPYHNQGQPVHYHYQQYYDPRQQYRHPQLHPCHQQERIYYDNDGAEGKESSGRSIISHGTGSVYENYQNPQLPFTTANQPHAPYSPKVVSPSSNAMPFIN